ncbi:MAG: hypothetical protein ACK5Q7_04075 [Cyanobacteriota bacterium]
MQLVQKMGTLLPQLLIAIQKGFEAFIELVLKDLGHILQQPLVARDLALGSLDLIEGGEMSLFLVGVVGHRRKAETSRLTDLNR